MGWGFLPSIRRHLTQCYGSAALSAINWVNQYVSRAGHRGQRAKEVITDEEGAI